METCHEHHEHHTRGQLGPAHRSPNGHPEHFYTLNHQHWLNNQPSRNNLFQKFFHKQRKQFHHLYRQRPFWTHHLLYKLPARRNNTPTSNHHTRQSNHLLNP